MKTTCIINNFNYQNFVIDAVKSALQQSVSFDEIIIVDDHSQDNSVALLQTDFAKYDQVKIIAKPQNEGQLSCFNTAFAALSGDLVFFLDADDLYHQRYLETALYVYNHYPSCDFLFSDCCNFEQDRDRYVEVALPNATQLSTYIQDLGYSMLSALVTQRYVGSVTSTLSMRTSLLRQVLPIPYLQDWRTRADDCLVFGASIAGGRKYQLHLPLVGYRAHGHNAFNQKGDLSHPVSLYQRELAVQRLFSLFCHRQSYHPSFITNASLEFRTIPEPTWALFFVYFRIIMEAQMPGLQKLKSVIRIFKHKVSGGGVRYTILGRVRASLRWLLRPGKNHSDCNAEHLTFRSPHQ
jgi:glycosyltransferase involved in cell wall biosynthesis